MDAAGVPVVERREGILRPGGDGSHQRRVVGLARPAIHHPLRAPAPAGFGGLADPRSSGSGRPSKPVVNTTSVSVENTCCVVWTARTTSPRCSMSRARILRM